MAYKNPSHRGRLIVIPVVQDAYANLFKSYRPHGAHDEVLALSDPAIPLSIEREGGSDLQRHIYNFPFLMHSDGTPWVEANGFFLNMVEGQHARNRPTDLARRRAGHLLEYKQFCERLGLDWLDFTGRRRSHRPTFKYFRDLLDRSIFSPAVINQRTHSIFEFYRYVSICWHNIDLARVDTCKETQIHIPSFSGDAVINVRKRSQTVRRALASEVDTGYVREDGEVLRPLTNLELEELLRVIHDKNWSQLERLIIKMAITTGARKQTIFTLKVRHLHAMKSRGIDKDGTYKLHAGPRTGLDTKFDKKQTLSVTPSLLNQLLIYSSSELSEGKRRKFLSNYRRDYPDLPIPDDADIYVFLSEQGNPYYMAKDDRRFPFQKSRQVGQMTDHLKRKLLKKASRNFPKDFSFHWLRATYGYQIYQWLLPLVQQGKLKFGEEIEIIQRLMHHKNRETTENYLKLYSRIDEKLSNQEIFEEKLFGNIESLNISGASNHE